MIVTGYRGVFVVSWGEGAAGGGIETVADTKTGTCSVLTLREGPSQSKFHFRPESTNATANTPLDKLEANHADTLQLLVASPVRKRSASLAFL